MSNKGVSFQGVNILKPGVYTYVDSTAMVPSRAVPGGVVGYLGPADGGTPGKVYEFTSYDEAAKVLKGGPVLSYMSRIFQPSADLPGASLVRFIRPGSATNASYAVNASLTLTSLDSGRSANNINFSLDAGASDATLKTRSSGGVDTAFTVRTATIQRCGEGYKRTQALRHGLVLTCSVTTTGTNKNSVVRDVDGAAGTIYLVENGDIAASLPFTALTTVKDVAAWMNNRSGWKATVIGDYDMPAGCVQFPLGSGTPADATYEANGAPVNATGFLTPAAGVGALAYMFNRYDAQIEASVTSYTSALPSGVVNQASFSGGTGSGYDTMSASDVTAALAVLATVDCQNVFLQSHDPALQQLVYQHVLSMRTITAKKYRVFYAGFNAYPATLSGSTYTAVSGANAEGVPVAATESWVDKAVDAAKLLDGPVVLCANGTVSANPVTGLSEQLYGLGFAAQVCGLAAGNAAVEPLTNKSVLSQSLQYATISDSELNSLLEGGVTVAYHDQTLSRTVLVQALTTFQGGANVTLRKLQGLRIQDAINRGFQGALGAFVGYPLDLVTGTLIKQACAAFLDGSIRSGSNPDGFLTPGTLNGQTVPAWTNLKVVGDGLDSWTITVEAHPVGESAYILVTTKLTPVAIQL